MFYRLYNTYPADISLLMKKYKVSKKQPSIFREIYTVLGEKMCLINREKPNVVRKTLQDYRQRILHINSKFFLYLIYESINISTILVTLFTISYIVLTIFTVGLTSFLLHGAIDLFKNSFYDFFRCYDLIFLLGLLVSLSYFTFRASIGFFRTFIENLEENINRVNNRTKEEGSIINVSYREKLKIATDNV